MSRVAAIGEAMRVQGFGLAGALVFPAGSPGQALAAWQSLPPDVTLVLVTPRAARWLDTAPRPGDVLLVVMP